MPNLTKGKHTITIKCGYRGNFYLNNVVLLTLHLEIQASTKNMSLNLIQSNSVFILRDFEEMNFKLKSPFKSK